MVHILWTIGYGPYQFSYQIKIFEGTLKLRSLKFRETNAVNACDKKQLYIPTSVDDFVKVMTPMQVSKVGVENFCWLALPISQKLWSLEIKHQAQLTYNSFIFTDYKRINDTFFWSDAANEWWSLHNEHQ